MAGQLPTDAEINQIQREFRLYQSESKEIKELLTNQTDSSRRVEFAETNQWSGDRKTQAGITSSAGAIGPMQIMPGHAGKDMGYGVEKFSRQDLNNPRKNIKTGTQYIKGLESKIGNRAPIAYNWGPKNEKYNRKWNNATTVAEKEKWKGYFKKNGDWVDTTKLPEETKRYLKRYKKGGSYKTYVEAEATSTIKRMLDAHISFMEKHAVKSLEKRHNIPVSYGEQIVDQQIELAKKFDKKDVSIKDLEKFNLLIARQLGSLGLRD
jgi:hypothetical protein